jgi:VanZ family protein
MTQKKQSFPWFKFLLTSLFPLLAWMGIIFFFSSQQKVAVTSSYALSFIIFKSLHLIEYFTLYCLWLRFFHYLGCKHQYLWAFIFILIYAFSDELHQLFTPTREGLLRDVLIDGLGGLSAMLIIHHFPKLQKLFFI